MLDHILTAIYPGELDAFRPGVLSRVDYERTRAVMIGQGLIDAAPSYDDFVLKGASRAP
jgi:hypothetical protein